MSGEKKSLNYNDKLEEFKKNLDDYLVQNGLHCVQFNSEVEEVLCFDVNSYKGLSAEDTYAYVLCLENYSWNLAKEYNRHNNINIWANNQLDYVIMSHWDDYAVDGYNDKTIITNKIIRDSEPARILMKIITMASSRKTELENMSRKAETYRAVLEKMGDAKRWRK